MHMYERGGFRVGSVLMDNEFEKLRPLLPTLVINTTAASEHVPDIERCMHPLNQRAREGCPEHTTIQENASRYFNRANLSRCFVAQHVPVQIGDIGHAITAGACWCPM